MVFLKFQTHLYPVDISFIQCSPHDADVLQKFVPDFGLRTFEFGREGLLDFGQPFGFQSSGDEPENHHEVPQTEHDPKEDENFV